MSDLTKQRFGRWTVIGDAPRRGRSVMCTARCDCGNVKIVNKHSIVVGNSTNCGCGRKETLRGIKPGLTHGMWSTPTYTSWKSMWDRCTLKSNISYPYYGGNGVVVCERWAKLENFLADMGPRPPGTTLDRWPVATGNYEPGNCRWATVADQNRNKSNVIPVTWGDRTMTLAEWSREVGVGYTTLRERLRTGWSVERALTTTADARRRQPSNATGSAA